MSILRNYSKFLDEKQDSVSPNSKGDNHIKNDFAVIVESPVPVKVEELVEENCSSLWQYSIQDSEGTKNLEILMPILMMIIYALSFYSVIIYLLETPIYHTSFIKKYFNAYILLLCKWMFILVLCIQAECECYDGWRIYLFAEGHLKKFCFSEPCNMLVDVLLK